ncbi:Oidioi.mRNA.OKI2018_I69.chrUn_2.g17217.t1.cds [Oikopleura dioica]|uniref:DNA polymerase n=1 Tax=Oikopleura dioica TaxID=34765 RepID=A0ABN7TGW6_OIKDI|nr:Oidioi.mRNA.OKI2018_I69.chrUn_2.g17217.t1.cds [Oikopleura dioica]
MHDFSIFHEKTQDNVFDQTLHRVDSMAESPDFRCSYSAVCIEVFSDGRQNLPQDPKEDPLTAVCIVYYHSDEDREDETWLLYTRDKIYSEDDRYDLNPRLIFCKNEMTLFDKFARLFQSLNPDVVLGWEMRRRSLGFLIKRAVFGLGWKKFGLCLSRHFGGDENNYFEKATVGDVAIPGRTVLEFWRLAADELSLRSTSFEAAAYEVLGKRTPMMKRIKMRIMWNSTDWEKVLNFLTCRTERLALMIKKIGLLEIGYEVSGIANVSMKDSLTRGCQVRHEGIFGNCCTYLEMVMDSPTEADVRESRAGEQIALNLEPESGMYTGGVAVLDFTSLYPSVIIAQNMCYTTILGNYQDHLNGEPQNVGTKFAWALPREQLPDETDVHYASTNCCFVNKEKRMGILPQIQTKLLSSRAAIKKMMKSGTHSHREYKMLDSRQHALKMIANTMYGYTDAGFSGRMPNRHLAEAIVGDARCLTERAAIACRDMFGKTVIYGDTDSVFVDMEETVNRENIGDLIDYVKTMAEEITAMFPPPIDLKFEKVYWPCILETKKRYCGYPWEKAGKKPELESKGIENIRRDGVLAGGKLVTKAAKTLFDMVVDGKLSFSKLKGILIDEIVKIKSNPIAFLPDLIFEKSWRGYDGYAPGAKIPAWKIARIKYKRGGPLNGPPSGERIKYCVAVPTPESGESVFSRTWEVEEFLFGDLQPDIDWIIRIHILPGLERLLGAVHPLLRASRWEEDITGQEASVTATNGSWKTFSAAEQCIACEMDDPAPNNVFCEGCKENSAVMRVVANEKEIVENDLSKYQRKCFNCHKEAFGTASIEDLDEEFCTNLDCSNNYRLIYTERNMPAVLRNRLFEHFCSSA